MKRPYFAICSIGGIEYRGKHIRNDPVNLSLCKSIKKSNFAWYPDNTGQPSIVFNGCDIEWVFRSVADRDVEFLRVCYWSPAQEQEKP